MAGIFQGDIIIKAAIELGIQDLKDNPWLVDHMLDDLINIPYLSSKYGTKQVEACKEWLRNNKIEISLSHRKDRDQPPCISIEMGPSSEKTDMKHLADQSAESVILLPEKIGKPIAFVVKPFSTFSYNPTSGLLTITGSPANIGKAVDGMVLVNPDTGEGYIIQSVEPAGFQLEPSLVISASKLGVVPQHRYYTARVEHSFFAETYTIGCHAHGDPQVLLWLWSIAKYSILRYRESLLEANGFTESSLSSAGVQNNETWTTAGGEEAWSRYITLQGQIENSWIKSPRRIIESIGLKDHGTSGSFAGGIKIISNSQPISDEDSLDEPWYPIDGDDE